MRKYFNDFTRYAGMPEGVRLTLGTEERDPGLRDLRTGEEVLLIYPSPVDGLLAVATVYERQQIGEYTYWTAVIPGLEAIVDLPLQEAYAGLPPGYDGQEFWEELKRKDPRLAIPPQQREQEPRDR